MGTGAIPLAMQAKVRANFINACAGLYRIRPRQGAALAPFVLWPEQLRQARLMATLERQGKPVRIARLKPRQAGDSTLAEAWLFHHVHWTPETNGIIVAHDDEAVKGQFEILQRYYDNLPPLFRHRKKKLNRREMAFELPHGSTIYTATAGWGGIGHSKTIQHQHLTECDLWPDPPAVLEGLGETCPLMPDTSAVIECVPQSGDGWFASFWRQIKTGGTEWVPLFTPAHKVPVYRREVPPDFRRTDEEQERVRAAGFAPAEVPDEFLAWYRAKEADIIAREPWGGQRKARRLYPLSDEESLQSSGLCIFPDVVLARLREGLTDPRWTYALVPVGDMAYQAHAADREHADLLVWKKREEGRQYVLGVDVGEGVGQSESVIQVLAYPGYEQVATWASSSTAPDRVAWIVAWLAERYAPALIIPEVNKSGVLLLYMLNHLPGAFDLFRWRTFDRPGVRESNDPKLGWETNVTTKGILAQVANLLFLRNEGWVRDAELHAQMRSCVDLLPGRRWAAAGKHTLVDRILAWMIAMVGAYLDLEGGVVEGMGAVREGREPREERPRHREQNSYDVDGDSVLAGSVAGWGGHLDAGDVGDV